MIIDAHNHPDWLGHDIKKTLENMDQYHIDKAWMLTCEFKPDEFEPAIIPLSNGFIFDQDCSNGAIPFAKVLEYKRLAPERFVLGYAPDPRRCDSLMTLKSAVDMYDVQVCGEIKYRMMYDNPDAIDMFRFCGDVGLPVTLHFDYPEAQLTNVTYPRRHYWYGGGIDVLERVLQLCPNTNFLGHAPGFWCHISNDDLGLTTPYPKGPVIPNGRIEQLLEKYPNLYCDMSAGSCYSALSRDMDYTYKLMTRFPERFVYARDLFTNIHQELLEKLNLSKDVLELIYHGNAERLVRKETGYV